MTLKKLSKTTFLRYYQFRSKHGIYDLINKNNEQILKTNNKVNINLQKTNNFSIEDKEIPKGWGFPKFLIFILCNFVPIAIGISLLKRSLYQQEKTEKLPETSEEIIDEATKVVNNSKRCWCLASSKSGSIIHTRIDPTTIEESVPECFKNSNIFSRFGLSGKESSIPFNFIHFCLSKKSSIIKNFINNSASIQYEDTNGKTVILNGIIQIINDEKQKKYYWKNSWSNSIYDPYDYILVKMKIDNITLTNFGNGYEMWICPSVIRKIDNNTSTWNRI
eukprot:GHVL01010373.1.p1 GENE.GHVL01010373.1~~GHVL01010373.1.p1  ORF type:complete len:295 (+),score=68.32 GHVL01010373.1:57-887(+)